MGTHKNKGGMSFRDLESFNKALLTKKLWRILNQPQFLIATVLKEKYYKTNKIKETKARSNLF